MIGDDIIRKSIQSILSVHVVYNISNPLPKYKTNRSPLLAYGLYVLYTCHYRLFVYNMQSMYGTSLPMYSQPYKESVSI